MAPNGISFGGKSNGKVWLQSKFDVILQYSESQFFPVLSDNIFDIHENIFFLHYPWRYHKTKKSANNGVRRTLYSPRKK